MFRILFTRNVDPKVLPGTGNCFQMAISKKTNYLLSFDLLMYCCKSMMLIIYCFAYFPFDFEISCYFYSLHGRGVFLR